MAAEFNWDDYESQAPGRGIWNPDAPVLDANGNYVPRDTNIYDQGGNVVNADDSTFGPARSWDDLYRQASQPSEANKQAALTAFRDAAAQAGVRVDEGDAAAMADPRFQQFLSGGQVSWGGPAPAGGGFSSGAPQSIQPFTERFTAPTLEQAQAEPGYQFSLNEGLNVLKRGNAAVGTLRLPGTDKALVGYAQDRATQNYSDVYNRAKGEYDTRFGVHQWNEGSRYNSERQNRMDDYGIYDSNRAFDEGRRLNDFNIYNTQDQNQWNRTYQLADLGLRAAGGAGAAGQNYANSASDIFSGQGDASAASRIARSNAISNGVNTVANNTMTLEQLRRRDRGYY